MKFYTKKPFQPLKHKIFPLKKCAFYKVHTPWATQIEHIKFSWSLNFLKDRGQIFNRFGILHFATQIPRIKVEHYILPLLYNILETLPYFFFRKSIFKKQPNNTIFQMSVGYINRNIIITIKKFCCDLPCLFFEIVTNILKQDQHPNRVNETNIGLTRGYRVATKSSLCHTALLQHHACTVWAV